MPRRPKPPASDDGMERLLRELRGRPDKVLDYFKRCQVRSLRDLDLFRWLEATHPAEAEAIRQVAERRGIPTD